MEDNGATLPILKWIAGTTSIVVASAVVWVSSMMIGDLRTFGVSLARLETSSEFHATALTRLDGRVLEIEKHLRPAK